MTDPREAEVLRGCRRGDEAAWSELFDRHYAAAGRFVHQISASFTPEDVEEICQEAFLNVIQNIFSFQGQSRFQTWLFRIAANKAHDFLERRQTAKRGGGQSLLSLNAEDPDGLSLDPPGPGPAPDMALVNEETMSQVVKALERLGQPCREVIELRYFADLSYDEIAAALALNPKTVSSRLSKCLDRLEAVASRMLLREKTKSLPVQ
jgi:RNA polymerase sigma-70 factor, ECF subfamily